MRQSREYVQFKEVEGKKFYYVDFGSEAHGRKSFRLWVSSKLIVKDEGGRECIEFPIRATIVQTEKGTLVLKPSEDTWVFDIYQPSGYRGDSLIEILSEFEAAYWYYVYASPRGNLGIDTGGLVVTRQDKLKIKWERTGRTYGAPKHGIRIYYSDGRVEDIEDISELKDLEMIDDE